MKLEAQKFGMFTEAQNDEIVLAGGFRSGSSPNGTTRLKYDIYSKSIMAHLDKTAPDMNDTEKANKAKVGVCELFVKNGTVFEFDTLVNIEITRKRKGYGTTVIQSLRDTVDGDLTIRDIQHSAAKFWQAQGIEFDRPIKDISKKAAFQGGVNGKIAKDSVAPVKEKTKSLEM